MARCRPCLDAVAKDLLSKAMPQRAAEIAALADCPQGVFIETCEAQNGRRTTKRPPSAYNLFVKACLPRQPKPAPITEKMRSCAAEWRQQKGR